MSAQYPRANAFEEPVEDQPYAASWASLSQHGEIAASRVVPTHTPTDQEQPSYQSIPSTVQYSYQPQWPILDQPLGNYGGLAVEHGFQPQLLPSQQTLNSQYGPPVFNRSSQLHTASLQQSLGDHTGVIAFGHSPFRQPPAPQQQLYAYNHPTTGTASGLQAMPSAQTPSYYSSGLAVADIFGAQPLPYGSHERPLSDQEFPNHTASQFVGRHDSAAGSQLSPISNTFHPNPSPTQNQVPVPEDTYDPEWFQKSGIDESVLDDFPGRMKMIHLFYHGIMVKNDCLQLDVECPLREGRCTLTASFHVCIFLPCYQWATHLERLTQTSV